MIRDLEAVVEQLGLQRFVLFAAIHAGAAAIAYTTLHPANVSISSSGMRMHTDGNSGSQLRHKRSFNCEKSRGICTRRRPRKTPSVGRRGTRHSGSPR
jgi:hypothetical protein